MIDASSTPAHQGSNHGAAKLAIGLILGAVLVGGFSSLLGPGSQIVGTWQLREGESFDVFRFESDGSYWRRASSGIFNMTLGGSYRVLHSSGDTYRVELDTELGKNEIEIRFETPDQIVEVDPDQPDSATTHDRVGDWVMARRPSKQAATYDGASPHVGCWSRPGIDGPALEIREDGTLIRHRDGETVRAEVAVDYTQLPFHFDVTESGEVVPGIFDFHVDGFLRIRQANQPGGERPTTLESALTFVPCSGSLPEETAHG